MIVTLLLFAIGWVVVRGAGAISELHNIERSIAQLQASISERDTPRVSRIAPRIAHHAALAHELTSDPIWRAFEFIPWLGANFTATREVAEIADDTAADVIASVVDATGDIDLATLGFTGTKLDLAIFAEIEPTLADAADRLAQADLRAQQINAEGVIAALTDAVHGTQSAIADAATTVGALHGAAVLAPTMLGADGPRNYVIVVQNNADVRSAGGSIAALTLMRADSGTISIARQASASDFVALKTPLELSESTTALLGDLPGRNLHELTSIPDFAEAGAAIATRWEQKFGGTVDGLIAVDAVVLQHLIDATGPVTFGAYTMTAETDLRTLLTTLHTDAPPAAAHNALLATATQSIITAALDSAEPRQIFGALADAADENRIRIWSAHPAEQQELQHTRLSGTPPVDTARGTSVGVLINDTTGAAMNVYTDAAITTAIGMCHGEPTTQVRVTWMNNAPVNPEEPLPAAITGGEREDMVPGDARTLIAIYGPEGAELNGDVGESAMTATLGERGIIQREVIVAPGESKTVVATFTGGGAGERLTRVVRTPLLGEADTMRAEVDCG